MNTCGDRYAVASCAKLIGGYTFQYGTKEAGKQPTSQALQTPVPATVQLAALDQVWAELYVTMAVLLSLA